MQATLAAQGFSATKPEQLTPAIRDWLAAPGVAVLDVQIDPEEKAESPDKVAV